MRMFNPTLEGWETQCDSIVFKIRPARYDESGKPVSGFVEVPDHLVEFMYQRFKDRGLMKYPVGMSDEAFEEEKRKALLSYLGIFLKERIVNFNCYHDDLRKKGVTIMADPRFDRALKWDKELREILNAQAPIEEELSFLDTVRRKNTELPIEPEEEVTSFNQQKKRTRKVEAQAEAIA